MALLLRLLLKIAFNSTDRYVTIIFEFITKLQCYTFQDNVFGELTGWDVDDRHGECSFEAGGCKMNTPNRPRYLMIATH